MTYLAALPGPQPGIDDQAFWDFCRARELRFQRCRDCGHHRAPPQPTCPRCQSAAADWVEAKDEAELFSYTIVHYKADAVVAGALPYNVAIVNFPSFDNVRLVSTVVGVPNAELRIGMKLRLVWETAGDRIPLPRFTASEDRR
jgi:uncharacterized OB-fold protein